MSSAERVLVLTPVKQARKHLDRYFANLDRLDYPADAISLGLLVSDSEDGTFEALQERLPELEAKYARVTLLEHDFGFTLPNDLPRWAPPLQIVRRAILARSRNRLLFASLRDEDWVLWVDVDLEEYRPEILTLLLETGKEIVQPHCVTEYGGQTFDWNAWRDGGETRMDALRGGPDLVRLDAVGGTMLLIRADIHRDGLIFPPYLYGRESRFARNPTPFVGRGVGELETEGLGLMAKDMGHEVWGMPNLEIVHRNE